MKTRIWILTLVASAAVACSDTPASLEPLAPDGPSLAKDTTLNGGTGHDINDAIQAVADAGGGTVFLNGTYYMDVNVGLESGVNLKGGSDNRLICDSGYHFFQTYTGTDTLSNVTIEGLNAEACSPSVAPDASFLSLYHSGAGPALISNVTIRNNTIDGFHEHGIQIAGAGTAGRQRFASVVIDGNRITNIERDAIQLGGRDSRDCCVNGPVDVTDNYISTIGKSGVTKSGFGIHVAHADDIDILSNRVEKTCEEGIRVTVTRNARIKYNAVVGVLPGTCDTSGIKSDQSVNVTIQADTVKGMLDKPHIKIDGGSGISILDNYVRAQSVNDGQVGIELRSGSAMGRVTDVVIDGNDVKYAQHGMKFVAKDRDIDNIDVTDNVVSACTGIWLTYEGDANGHILYVDMLSNWIGEYSVTGCNANDSITLYGVGHSNVWYNTLWTRWNEAYAWDMDYRDNIILDE